MLDGALLLESDSADISSTTPLDKAEKDLLIRQAGHKIKKLLGEIQILSSSSKDRESESFKDSTTQVALFDQGSP